MQHHDNLSNLETWIKTSISDLHAMMIINEQGILRSYFVSKQCANSLNLTQLQNLAKLISIRYSIGGFNEAMGKLEFTINSFKNIFVLVKQIHDSNYMALLIPKNSSLDENVKILHELDKKLIASKESILKKIPDSKSEFEKNKQNYYEQLEPNKFILVADTSGGSVSTLSDDEIMNQFVDSKSGESTRMSSREKTG